MDVRRYKGKWQCRAKSGAGYKYKTFHLKRDAEAWGRRVESGLAAQTEAPNKMTVGELIDRYMEEVLPQKQVYRYESYILNKIKKDPLSRVLLSEVTMNDIEKWRDRRLSQGVQMSTVARESHVLGDMFSKAKKPWKLLKGDNPVSGVRFQGWFKRRKRRLESWEKTVLLNTATGDMLDLIELALETACRKGELLKICHEDIDFEGRTLHLRTTKTGPDQETPLTRRAAAILQKRIDTKKGDSYVFPLSDRNVRFWWDKLKEQCGIDNLHFHDLRHESLSHYADLGLETHELMEISRHKNLKTLSIYVHASRKNLLEKLDRAA